jgi:S1-C subfamily serine protease
MHITGPSWPLSMNFRLLVSCSLVLGFVAVSLHATPAKPDKAEIVKLEPFVVESTSLANAGFRFKARFHHHLIEAGIRELVIVEVGPQSEAKKAGLAVGEKILQIRDVKVEGLGLEELQNEFQTKAEDGKVPLLIQSKGSDETRTVVLQFKHSPPKKASN